MYYIISIPSDIFTLLFKISFIAIFVSSLAVVINAILSAKALGGELGMGLKKIAGGTIAHVIVIITFLSLEKGGRGLLNDDQVKLFFMITGLFGSSLLILGYLQIYQISKRLKLF